MQEVTIEVSNIVQEKRDYIKQAHTFGHARIASTYSFIKNTLGREDIPLELVKEVIGECSECLKFTRHRHVYKSQGSIKNAMSPGAELHCDTLILERSEGGYCGIVILVCGFTGYCRLYPIRTHGAEESAVCLMDWCGTFGPAQDIRNDQGKVFNCKIWSIICNSLWMRHLFTMVKVKSSNGVAENYCKQVLDFVLKKCSEFGQSSSNWDSHVEACQLALNCRSVSRTGMTPMELMFGRNPFAREVEIEVEVEVDGLRKRVRPCDLSRDQQIELYMKRWKWMVEEIWPQARSVIDYTKIASDDYINGTRTIADGLIRHDDFVMYELTGTKKKSKMDLRYLGPLKVKKEDGKDHKFIFWTRMELSW